VAFPRHLLVYGTDPFYDGTGTPGVALSLVSESLRMVGKAPNPRPVLRAIFYRDRPKDKWPEDTFPWRPMSEAARMLATCCTKRLAWSPCPRAEPPVVDGTGAASELVSPLKRLLAERVATPAAMGCDASWETGAVILLPAAASPESSQESKGSNTTTAAPSVALVGLLYAGEVRAVYQKGLNLAGLAF